MATVKRKHKGVSEREGHFCPLSLPGDIPRYAAGLLLCFGAMLGPGTWRGLMLRPLAFGFMLVGIE